MEWNGGGAGQATVVFKAAEGLPTGDGDAVVSSGVGRRTTIADAIDAEPTNARSVGALVDAAAGIFVQRGLGVGGRGRHTTGGQLLAGLFWRFASQRDPHTRVHP